jgi:hypothetical protein
MGRNVYPGAVVSSYARASASTTTRGSSSTCRRFAAQRSYRFYSGRGHVDRVVEGCIFLIGMNMCYLRNEPLVLGESGFSGCFRQFLQ